jgi:hypothetical protein
MKNRFFSTKTRTRLHRKWLHSLAEGEKIPLTKYNEAIQRLQRKRSMMSVAEQKSQFRRPSEPTAPATPNPTTNPPLENPAAAPGRDDDEGMLVDENVEEELEGASKEPNESEIERILDELADGIPELTLVRLSEDVALDMDEVAVDVIDDKTVNPLTMMKIQRRAASSDRVAVVVQGVNH